MSNRRFVGALVLALALGVAGCGIPTSQSAQPLTNSGTIASSTTTTSPGGAAHVFVYFLRAGRLVQEMANVSPANQTQLLDQALVILGYGPTAREARAGITTDLPAPRATSSVMSIQRGVVTVVLDPSFTGPGMFGTRLSDALGQIVFTVTTTSSVVSSVLFFLDGQPFDAFLPVGAPVSRPVSKVDYAEIAPRKVS